MSTGVGGLEGDGDIFRPDNQEAFIKFVHDNTDGQGVHFVMADGVRFCFTTTFALLTSEYFLFYSEAWQGNFQNKYLCFL